MYNEGDNPELIYIVYEGEFLLKKNIGDLFKPKILKH